MLELLLPNVVASYETRDDVHEIALFPSEQRALGNAVEKRRREFTTGRACARAALAALGQPPVAIPSGTHGEPLWPPGIVGSITHCAGYRACAVARANSVAAIGIDAEPNVPLPADLFAEIAFGTELTRFSVPLEGAPEVDAPRLLFSAKEAVYKAWFGLTQRWLGFEDAELTIDACDRTFHAALHVEGPTVAGAVLQGFDGRWALRDGVIGTAVVVRQKP